MIMLLLVYLVYMTTQLVMLFFAMVLQLPLFFYNSAISTAVTLFQVYASK